MTTSIAIICGFTFCIHFTETLVYSMRLAGVRTRQLATAFSFVSSSLLVSRLSNMFQAPLLGAMVDKSVQINTLASTQNLEMAFRTILIFAFLGSLAGALCTPSAVQLFMRALKRFKTVGSLPRIFISAFYPQNIAKIPSLLRLPRLSAIKTLSFTTIPKGFLILNTLVTSIYAIGVLCSLLASAYLPEMRSTANQLSGIVNGMATIMFTLLVDPTGARITDQAFHNERPENDVRSVIFGLLAGRLIGTLIITQLLLKPLSHYIAFITQLFH